MNNHKAILFEAPDNVGKTTVMDKVSQLMTKNKCIYNSIHQPSGTNVVGYLRDEVKYNMSYNPFERQLLHTISHTHDLYTEFRKYFEYVLMDRSFISTMVYSKFINMSDDNRDLLECLNKKTYIDYFKKNDIKWYVVHITNSTPFQKDNDLYSHIEWNNLYEEYNKVIGEIDDTYHNVLHIENKDIDMTVNSIYKFITGR